MAVIRMATKLKSFSEKMFSPEYITNIKFSRVASIGFLLGFIDMLLAIITPQNPKDSLWGTGDLLLGKVYEVSCYITKFLPEPFTGMSCDEGWLLYGFIMTPLTYALLCLSLFLIIRLLILKSKKLFVFFILVPLFLFIIPDISAYSMGEGTEVHQWITKESGEVWNDMPDEINAHLQSPYDGHLSVGYQLGNDIISGSGEEDLGFPATPWREHFWQPDNPQNGLYKDGLDLNINPLNPVQIPLNQGSSYRRARNLKLEVS